MRSKKVGGFFSQGIRWIIFFVLLFYPYNSYSRTILKVFHAGSLSVPFKRIEKAFEKRYPYIDVRTESSGSVMAVRKVIDLHKECDVIAVADYSLIPSMMFPRYADHVYLFARNELVICYREGSKYSDMINQENWFNLLNRKSVRWGFSNPNDDPCGYRSVMCMLLSDIYYKKKISEMLIGKYLPFKLNRHMAIIPEGFSPKGRKIFIRPKEVDLLALLGAGMIDYCIEYLSVANQHHLRYLPLPPEINMGHLRFASYYKKVKVRLGNGKLIKGKPIIYGIAILKNSQHPKEARLFEQFVIGPQGAKILRESFQTPIYPVKLIRASEWGSRTGR